MSSKTQRAAPSGGDSEHEFGDPAGGPILAFVLIEDPELTMGSIEDQVPEDGDAQPGVPEVRVDPGERSIRVNVVGNPRARTVIGMTLGAGEYLEGEADGPVRRIARPQGSNAVAEFSLRVPLPANPTVYTEWEQSARPPMPSIRPLDPGEAVRILGDPAAGEDRLEALMAAKDGAGGCDE